jgi:ankyrin repeat protein
MLDGGYDLMHAMQDAMDEKKFMLVLTLLNKNPNDEVIQATNKKGQNLFHVLSMNAAHCSLDHIKRIYDYLLKRGVDCRAKDMFNRTALHYAVIGNSPILVRMLLDERGYNPNEIDVYGHSPLSLCIQGKASGNLLYHSNFGNVHMDNIFFMLVSKGADVNIVYPEKTCKPTFKKEEVDEEYEDSYDPEGQYLTTPLINVIRNESDFDTIMKHNIIGLIEKGAKLNIVDSDGRDPLMYAIM